MDLSDLKDLACYFVVVNMMKKRIGFLTENKINLFISN